MTIQQLYDKLNSKEFQESDNSLFYNYYIYQYEADKEYEMRKQLKEFKDNLVRPTSFVDVVMLDLFDTFCEYLDSQPFGKKYPSRLQYILEKDSNEALSDSVTSMLTNTANQDEFFVFVSDKIKQMLKANPNLKHPYVFVYGIGKMYPYLRTNVFLTKFEDYNEPNRYKIILFYPGHHEGNSFVLFNALHDQHSYRAILLVNE